MEGAGLGSNILRNCTTLGRLSPFRVAATTHVRVDSPGARSFEPTPIPLVDNVPVEASMAAASRSTMLERPRRLHVVGAEGQMVECRFASGMNLADEIAFQNPGDIEGVVFEGLDRHGASLPVGPAVRTER